MEASAAQFRHSAGSRCYTDFRRCLEETQPDIVLLCPKTGEHGDYVEWVAPYGVHILVEKPMAASLARCRPDARARCEATGKTLVINWPLAWYPPHVTTKRLIDEGVIGEVHRSPLLRRQSRPAAAHRRQNRDRRGGGRAAEIASWWYQKAAGGGSLLDYLGYGVTLGTWFHGGRAPIEVTCSRR